MKKVTLTKNQGVFLEKVAKIIEDDPKLIGFCKNRASGVTFVLKVIDNYIEDKYKGKPIKDGEVYINSKLLKILNKIQSHKMK